MRQHSAPTTAKNTNSFAQKLGLNGFLSESKNEQAQREDGDRRASPVWASIWSDCSDRATTATKNAPMLPKR
jgi:hypothetical protein